MFLIWERDRVIVMGCRPDLPNPSANPPVTKGLARSRICETRKALTSPSKAQDKPVRLLVGATNEASVQAQEARIAAIDRERALPLEDPDEGPKPAPDFEDVFERLRGFLTSPCEKLTNGGFAMRRAVLGPVFGDKLECCRKTGVRTARLGPLFSALYHIAADKTDLVEPRGVEPLTS